MDITGFAEVEHTADVALRVWGRDRRELFVNAARGLAWLLVGESAVEPTVAVELDLTAYDTETLLVTWLGELLYRHERDGLVFTAFDLHQVSPTHLRGTVRGGTVRNVLRHVKAVTFNQLDVCRTARGLETMLVFDV